GGGLPFDPAHLTQVGFAFFGGAGRLDFNFEEMRSLDAKLESMRVPHRFEPYDGPHSWGPEPVCAEAIDWMEIQAIKTGLRPGSEPLVAEVFGADLARAQALEMGDPLGALTAYRTIQRDYTGLHDVAGPAGKADELEKSKPVKQALARRQTLAARQTEYE